jgi:hypothetical protein
MNPQTTPGAIAIGYHGCDREVGERILAGEMELRPSTNDYDWLAEGGYLWENDQERGFQWARLLQRHGKNSRHPIREPFVLGAVVDLGNCLDLLRAEPIRLVRDAYQALKQAFAETGQIMPVNKRVKAELALRNLDCAVIQYLHQRRAAQGLPAFDTIRAAFPEGRELYPGAGFQEHTHIQICVRNPRQIVGYFRVRHRG